MKKNCEIDAANMACMQFNQRARMHIRPQALNKSFLASAMMGRREAGQETRQVAVGIYAVRLVVGSNSHTAVFCSLRRKFLRIVLFISTIGARTQP